jgi:hypothetical protein
VTATHQIKLKAAKAAINAVAGDTSVSHDETRESLDQLQQEIDEWRQLLEDTKEDAIEGGE